jgi:RimJ/RimL family protein N-acetyltransferase
MIPQSAPSPSAFPLSFPYRPLVFLAGAMKRRVWYRRELRVYGYPLEGSPPLPRPAIFERNRFDDLEYYERTDKYQPTPEVYRKMALERKTQGFHLYTFVQERRLLHYGWLIERQTRGEDDWVQQAYFPPPDTSVLFDHFTHPSARGKGLYFQALCRLLHDARDLAGARQAYVTVFGSNAPSRHVIEKVGFHHEGSLYKERKLFWSTRYSVGAHDDFRTALL